MQILNFCVIAEGIFIVNDIIPNRYGVFIGNFRLSKEVWYYILVYHVNITNINDINTFFF